MSALRNAIPLTLAIVFGVATGGYPNPTALEYVTDLEQGYYSFSPALKEDLERRDLERQKKTGIPDGEKAQKAQQPSSTH